MGWELQYDSKTGQLVGADRKYFETETGTDADQWTTSLPSAFSFVTDAAYNLLSATETLACEATETRSMPLETSGRNRPEKLVESGGERDLVWDDSGHLLSKDYRDGDGNLSRLHFTYDGRGRLIEVQRGPDRATATPVATYVYDGLDRRIRRMLHEQSKTYRTVWDGWQPIEDYEILPDQSELLVARRVYGASLDDMLSSEILLSASDADLAAYTPVFDATGNLVLMIDAQGKPVERYEYGPYGERFVWVDATAPAVEQVRLEDGELIVELSEEVRSDVLESSLNGPLKLDNLTKSTQVTLTLSQPVAQGRRARHRLVFGMPETVADGAPEEGDQVRLTLPGVSLRDFFDNEPTSDYQSVPFAWNSTSSLIVDDQADPRLEDACVRNGKLELSFSETPDMALASTALLVDGATTTWTLLPDGYTLQHGGALASGSHSLELTQDGFDLVGKSLVDLGEPGKRLETFEIPMSGGHIHVYNALLPGEQSSSTIGSVVRNVYGFHGLPYDEETGFLYVRHRFYDPEIGRFLQPDAYGYIDAPNLYQYALGDPINNEDSLGLDVVVLWYGKHSEYGKGEGFDELYERLKKDYHARGMSIKFEEYRDWERQFNEIYVDDDFDATSPDSVKIYAVSNWKTYSAPHVDAVFKRISETLRDGERIHMIGHSRGGTRVRELASRFNETGRGVENLVVVDELAMVSDPDVAGNVEQFLSFYSSTDEAELSMVDFVLAVLYPDAKKYDLELTTKNLGSKRLDLAHTAMDSSPIVHDRFIILTGGRVKGYKFNMRELLRIVMEE